MRIQTRSFLISLIVLALSAPWTARAATVWPAEGYGGSKRETLTCRDGEYLVGLRGRVGAWTDQIGMLCAPLLQGGGLGQVKKRNQRGGSGGGPIEDRCRDGYLVTGLSIDISHDDRTLWGVTATCNRIGHYGASGVRAFLTPQGVDYPHQWTKYEQTCAVGEAAKGYIVHHGKHINALGLVCAEVVIPAVSTSGGGGASIGSFAGSWNTTVTGQPFALELQVNGNQVSGTFTHSDSRYSGTLVGTLEPNGREFLFTLKQNYGGRGSGLFALSADGMAIEGKGAAGGQSFVWTGRRR